jgi:hypothetical protein
MSIRDVYKSVIDKYKNTKNTLAAILLAGTITFTGLTGCSRDPKKTEYQELIPERMLVVEPPYVEEIHGQNDTKYDVVFPVIASGKSPDYAEDAKNANTERFKLNGMPPIYLVVENLDKQELDKILARYGVGEEIGLNPYGYIVPEYYQMTETIYTGVGTKKRPIEVKYKKFLKKIHASPSSIEMIVNYTVPDRLQLDSLKDITEKSYEHSMKSYVEDIWGKKFKDAINARNKEIVNRKIRVSLQKKYEKN